MTSTVSAVSSTSASKSGSESADGPSVSSSPACTSIRIAPRPTSTSEIATLRSAIRSTSPSSASAGRCSRAERGIVERSRRVRHETPCDLQEQKADRDLHAADQRLRERLGREVDQARPAEHDEDDAHQERAGRDLVRAEALGNRDRAERLQRLHRDRQPVDERDRRRTAGPAGSSTAVAESPFETISATAIGSSTPMSATAPESSGVPKRMPFPRIAAIARSVTSRCPRADLA